MLLASGKHVVSEVPACTTMEEADDLIRAVQGVEVLLYDRPRITATSTRSSSSVGSILTAVSVSCTTVRANTCTIAATFGTTRRRTGPGVGIGWRGIYCTHSLGPSARTSPMTASLLVSSLEVTGGRFDAAVTCPTNEPDEYGDRGRKSPSGEGRPVVAPAPPDGLLLVPGYAWEAYESWRGFGDSSKVWLADRDEPSMSIGGANWHSLAELAELVHTGAFVCATRGAVGRARHERVLDVAGHYRRHSGRDPARHFGIQRP